jgi:5-formyltetrahydrofolate cyclo-ligase
MSIDRRQDSPLRTTTGNIEAMALFAGRGAGRTIDLVPAGDRLRRMADERQPCWRESVPKAQNEAGKIMAENDRSEGRYASPPCLAGEIAPDYFDPLGVDPQQARDVARWRRAERVRLRAERLALGVEARVAAGAALSVHLRDVLGARFGDMRDRLFSAYWPIKGELDLRPLMADLHAAGVRVALPLVEVKRAPLVFRRWTPATRMVRGDWNIPVPPPEAEVVTPDVVLAPLVGWDRDCYRLGYGGGYFDRTLAQLSPRPFTIGIGLQAAELATIYPQPHDIRLDAIVTEEGLQVMRSSQHAEQTR